MKQLFFIVLLPFTSAFSNPMCYLGVMPLQFTGEFVGTHSTGAACDSVFKIKKYRAQHVQMGETGTTSLLTILSDDASAYFRNLTFVGLLGPDCDFSSNKDLHLDQRLHLIHAEGLVSRNILWAKVHVKVYEDDIKLCEASGEYTGYRTYGSGN